MTEADMNAWAEILRAKYGIIWPTSLTPEPEDLEDDEPIYIPFELT